MKLHRKTILFVLFVIIFISDDTLLFGTNENQYFIMGRFVLYGVMLLLCCNYFWKHVDRNILWPIGLILLSFLYVPVLNGDYRNGYLLQLLTVLLAIKIAVVIKFDDFIHYFVRFIYFISLFAIVVFFISLLVPSVIDLFPTISNYGGVNYATLVVANVMKIDGAFRSCSIFREPGVYCIYLLICIIYELFYLPRFRLKHLIVFIFALITTFSTTGYLLLALLIVGYIFQNKNLKVKMWLMILILVFVSFILPSLYDQVFSKLNPDNYEYLSTMSRVSSLVIPFMIFLNNPWGVGLSKFVDLYPIFSYQLFGIEFSPEGESTNTFINTFAIYGAIYGIILIFAVNRLTMYFKRSWISKIIIFLVFLLMFSSQELRFSLLFNILIVYGLLYRKESHQIQLISDKAGINYH